MKTNAIFFAWNRSIPGREKTSGQHFGEFVKFLTDLQQKGTISSFDVVFLNPHGGDMNGFFLIRGESSKLSNLIVSEDWNVHMTRASLHLESSGAVLGATGDAVMERMKLWTSLLPS